MIKKFVTIVLPAHNESGNIEFIVDKIEATFPFQLYELEILLVDDGSIDDTLEKIQRLSKKNKRVKFIELSRNFGHQCAVKAGMDNAKGDCVITMDCDMQHPPEVINSLLSEWEKGYDVVYTRRSESDDNSYFKRKTSNAFYKFFNWLSDTNIEKGTADFRLVDRRVAEAFSRFNENDLFIRGLIKWMGFKQIGIDYQPNNRHTGESKYTLKKMFRFALHGITSLSVRPLYLAIYMGFILSMLSLLYFPYVIYSYLYSGHYSYGWGSVILTIVFFAGLQLSVLGIIGIYIGKTFLQVKDRPLYIIKSTNLVR